MGLSRAPAEFPPGKHVGNRVRLRGAGHPGTLSLVILRVRVSQQWHRPPLMLVDRCAMHVGHVSLVVLSF